MGRIYRCYQIDCFTKEKFSGNPAGVITNADGLTAEEMLKIASELNNSETAFVFSPPDRSCDVEVRFFTPTNEVPICGHATIAAHYVRAVETGMDNARVFQKTGAGILPVDIVRQGNDYQVVMTQGRIEFGDILKDQTLDDILTALNLRREDLLEDYPVEIVSTGHSKVMIGIKSRETLNRIQPDLGRLAGISGSIRCNGYYIFTVEPGSGILIHGRMFAPAIGIPEDPVTGNANGPLGAYLAHYKKAEVAGPQFAFQAMQGEAIHRPGIVRVQVDMEKGEPVQVRISGDAVVAYRFEISL